MPAAPNDWPDRAQRLLTEAAAKTAVDEEHHQYRKQK